MKFTAEIRQLETFTYGTLLARKRWEQRTLSISPGLNIIVIFQNLRACPRLVIGRRNEPHKIKPSEIWKRRTESQRGPLPSVKPWTSDPTPAVWGASCGWRCLSGEGIFPPNLEEMPWLSASTVPWRTSCQRQDLNYRMWEHLEEEGLSRTPPSSLGRHCMLQPWLQWEQDIPILLSV